MTDEVFIVELGGRRWELPHLPFRLIKAIQPALFQVYNDTLGIDAAPLSEVQIDTLSGLVWRAVAHVDPVLTHDAFLSLPFSLADLFAALPAVARASGLRLQTATAEASPEAGKSISTP